MSCIFFFNDTATTEIYTYHTLSLHDALPIYKEHINIYTSSNRYFGSKVGKGLQLGFSYMPNACEDRGTSAGTAGSCQTFSSAANSSRSEEHTSELQSLMRISYAVFCLKKKT